MLVKIVSSGSNRLLQGKEVSFSTKDGVQSVIVDGSDPHNFEGKAYIMNDAGITVDTYPGRQGR